MAANQVIYLTLTDTRDSDLELGDTRTVQLVMLDTRDSDLDG